MGPDKIYAYVQVFSVMTENAVLQWFLYPKMQQELTIKYKSPLRPLVGVGPAAEPYSFLVTRGGTVILTKNDSNGSKISV